MSAIERAVEISGGQAKLAEKLGVTQSQISHWVNGAPVHVRHFQSIEKATGIPASELLAEAQAADRSRKRRRRNAA